MHPKFLLDECVEALLLDHIAQFNLNALIPIDAIRVGDASDLPLGTSDPDLIIWAEQNGRIIISRDISTLQTHIANHLAAGNHCPGLFLITSAADTHAIVEILAVATETDNDLEWQDLTEFLG